MSRGPSAPAPGAPAPGERLRRLAAALLWPAAVCALVQLGAHAATGPARDLSILWEAGARLRAGDGLYDAGREFIYPPLAGWVVAPLSVLPFRVACVVVAVLSIAALVAATVLALRLVGVPWRSPVTAGVLLALAVSRPVVGLLEQGNVDVLLVLVEVAVIRALVLRRDLLAAVLLGVVCALKPTLAPLLLAAVVLGRGTVALRGAVVAGALSLVGLLTVADGAVFVSDVVPLLGEGNRPVLQQWDRSLRGAADQLDLPSAVGTAARVLALAAALGVAWLRRRSPLAPLEVVPVLLLGSMLASSFSWANYSVYLLPLLVTLAVPGNLVRVWPAWVGVYLAWSAQQWPAPGNGVLDAALKLRPTWGWALLLGTCAWLAWRDHATARAAQHDRAQPAPGLGHLDRPSADDPAAHPVEQQGRAA